MTATEAALYNKLSGGALRRVLPSLTHQNLPLALFLENQILDTLHGPEALLEKCRMMPLSLPWASAL